VLAVLMVIVMLVGARVVVGVGCRGVGAAADVAAILPDETALVVI
jgi:hypothetical protein